jgi:predicted nucleic acid-binding protein
MVILIDTNVILDVIQGRKPYCEAATDIFKLCATKKITGYVAK